MHEPGYQSSLFGDGIPTGSFLAGKRNFSDSKEDIKFFTAGANLIYTILFNGANYLTAVSRQHSNTIIF